MNQYIEKARPAAPVGTRRMYSGVMHVKTPTRWLPEKYAGHLYPDPEKDSASLSSTTHPSVDSKATTKLKFPKLSDLEYLTSLGGSSDVKLASANGEKWAVKKARKSGDDYNNGQLEQEILADQIYSLFGFKTPESILIEDKDGRLNKISKFIPNLKELGAADSALEEKAKKEIKKGFVLDALLGNWDVIGQARDNILINPKDNTIYRIDNGGSLEYRAKGAKKDHFGSEIKELQTFLDSDANTNTAWAYKGITDEEIYKQAKEIQSNAIAIANLLVKFEDKYPKNKGIAKKVAGRLAWLAENIVDKYEKKGKWKEESTKTKSSEYLSVTTEKYFEDWDSLELEGNPEIKEGIKNQILQIEKTNQAHYEKYAKEHGISTEEYKQRLQSKIERLMSVSEYFRATDINILDKILTDHGRFKTQFETGTSHGSFSPTMRSEVEHIYFGFKNDIVHDKEKRPVYGYCSDNTNGVNNRNGTIPPPNIANHYGQVTIKIKKSVALKKATVTFDDSLGMSGHVAATPVAKPHFTSLEISSYKDPLDDDIESTGKRGSYTEIQYHNQLKFDDIESVHISINPTSEYMKDNHIENINKIIEIGRKTNVPIKIFGDN